MDTTALHWHLKFLDNYLSVAVRALVCICLGNAKCMDQRQPTTKKENRRKGGYASVCPPNPQGRSARCAPLQSR